MGTKMLSRKFSGNLGSWFLGTVLINTARDNYHGTIVETNLEAVLSLAKTGPYISIAKRICRMQTDTHIYGYTYRCTWHAPPQNYLHVWYGTRTKSNLSWEVGFLGGGVPYCWGSLGGACGRRLFSLRMGGGIGGGFSRNISDWGKVSGHGGFEVWNGGSAL